MHARDLLSIIPLLFIFSAAEAAERIIELPDRIVAELVGTPAPPVQPIPPPQPPEPYLVERFAEYPDRYEVELVGEPDQDKRKPAEHQMSASPQPTMLVMQTETVTEPPQPPPSAPSYGDASRTATTSPYYRELSERIRTLQKERQECLKTVPEDSREERERKRREAEEKLREIRAVSAEMAQLRNGGG